MENIRTDRNLPCGILASRNLDSRMAVPKMATMASGLSMMAIRISGIFGYLDDGRAPFYHLTAGE